MDNSRDDDSNCDVVSYTLSIYDILEKIFSYLNMKTLSIVSLVCFLWRKVARKQMLSRSEVEAILMPFYTTSFSTLLTTRIDKYFGNTDSYDADMRRELETGWNISKVVRSKPKVFIIFYEPESAQGQAFHDRYMTLLPRQSILVSFGFALVSWDRTELFGMSCLSAGISIPSTVTLKIEIVIVDDFSLPDGKIEKMVSNAMSALKVSPEEREHNCFLYFLNREGNNTSNFMLRRKQEYIKEFVKSLKKRCKPGTYSILGTGCLVMDVTTPAAPEKDWAFLVIMRIFGPALKSWSIVLSLYMPDDAMKEQLQRFKSKITVRSNTFAIATIPIDVEEAYNCSHEDTISANIFMRHTDIFKEQFPDIPLISLYDDQFSSRVGCNTLDDGGGRSVAAEYKHSIIYLVMTTC